MSGASHTIRRAGPEVVPELGAIYGSLNDHQLSMAPTLAGLHARDSMEAWRRRRAMYERSLATPGAFVALAERDARLVGYAVVSIGEGLHAWDSGERVGDLHDLAVLPAERGRGIGTALMNAVVHELRAAGIEEIRLRVIAANTQAIEFYSRRGLATISHVMLGRIA